MDNTTIKILLVEDDDIDSEAVKRAFKKLRIANPIIRARDGIQALEMLRGEAGRAKVPTPFIILLDINMPRMNGLEFLEELRKDEDIRSSIVFVLTTSEADKDKTEAYKHNIAGYILKSRAGEDFTNLIGLLDTYWRYVEIPK